MTRDAEDRDWEAATWSGSRRAQLRRSLQLSVRERLEALEAMAEVSERLAGLRGGGTMDAVTKRDANGSVCLPAMREPGTGHTSLSDAEVAAPKTE